MDRRALPTAVLVALALAATATVLRLQPGAGASGATGDRSATDVLPLLFAAAGLCIAALLRQRAPAGAWLATVSVGAISAIVILGGVLSMLATHDQRQWPVLVLIAEAGLLAAAAIAAGYGISGGRNARGRLHTAWRAAVLAGLAVVVAGGIWAVAEVVGEPARAAPLATPAPLFRVNARIAAAFITVLALAGIWRDLSGPFGRARSRSGSLRELPRALADELLPNASTARRLGRDEERARIAADLHAFVLPDLRRAAQAAEAAEASRSSVVAGPAPAGGQPVASDLRHALEGVERLMQQRQSIVLEEYGLVAALEWLAEQAQQRGGLVVDIELDGADIGNAAAIPRPIGRAAFRVALLALDNVVRHAAATRVLIRLDVDGGRGRLAVIDDGRGIEVATASLAGRGLIDMRTAANEVRAKLVVERGERGTAIEMAWAGEDLTAEDPATMAADITTRPHAPPA